MHEGGWQTTITPTWKYTAKISGIMTRSTLQ